MLEKISGYTKEQAKTLLLQNLDEELTHDKAVKIMDCEQRTKDEQDALAREIISTAIQRSRRLPVKPLFRWLPSQ